MDHVITWFPWRFTRPNSGESMYKVDVRVDSKESAAVERRRIQEQQRQSRIFDARQRLIGVIVSSGLFV